MKSIFRVLLSLGALHAVLTATPKLAVGVVLLDSLQGDQFTDQSTPAYYNHNFPNDDLRHAARFTVPSDGKYTLLPVDLLVAARSSSTQQLTVTLFEDAPDLPGSILDSKTLTNLPVRPDGSGALTIPITSVAFDNAPNLLAGQSYYVALSVPTGDLGDIYWWTNRSNQLGTLAVLSSPLNGTDWTVHENATLPRLTVRAVPVPEPASTILILSGLVGLSCAARSRSSVRLPAWPNSARRPLVNWSVVIHT